MARPKLQTAKGRVVAEWRVKPAEFKALQDAEPPKAGKIKTRAVRIAKTDGEPRRST